MITITITGPTGSRKPTVSRLIMNHLAEQLDASVTIFHEYGEQGDYERMEVEIPKERLEQLQ